jgi:iron complex outermembrane recepter protein
VAARLAPDDPVHRIDDETLAAVSASRTDARPRHRLVLLGVAWVIALATAASAQTAPSRPRPADLKALSIEELMEIDVALAGRRSERVVDAAAAVSIISREDIRRAGVNSVSEALRLANALFVGRAQSATWAISPRGFATETSNKLLVMIDGRSIYSPLFSGVFWDEHDLVLEDIDRIEVVRGPAAALWGPNAVNGVINVVTRHTSETHGTLLSLRLGNEERASATARYGGAAGERGHYRVFSRYTVRDEARLVTGEPAGDDWSFGHAGFRVDFGDEAQEIGAQGQFHLGRRGQFQAADIEMAGGHLQGHWRRQTGPTSHVSVRTYFDRRHRRVPPVFEEWRNTFDIGLEHQFPLGARHRLVWGGGYRVTADDTVPSPTILFDPEDRTWSMLGGFVNDQVLLVPDRITLTLGVRVDRSDFTGAEVQPTVRARWTPTVRQTVWGAVSRAVRTPSRLDRDTQVFAGGVLLTAGSRDFRSESVVAYEAGYRVRPQPHLVIDVATFHNRHEDVRSREFFPGGSPQIVAGNTLRARSSGLELVANYQPVPMLRTFLSYAYLDLGFSRAAGSRDVAGLAPEANDPRHQFAFRWTADLGPALELDGSTRRIGALPYSPVPAYTEASLRLGWRVAPHWDVSFIGRDLLHDTHLEFASPTAARLVLVERSLSVRLTVAF